MDCLLTNEVLSAWLIQYGSISLFFLLVLGIIALPIPEETLMILSGMLMSQGKLIITSTLIAAYAGAICGISVSYLLGHTAGKFLIIKYGSWVGITESRLKQVENWFHHYGKWTLPVGYFVPGIRHLTGFSCGITMQFKEFAPFAYAGAVIWVTTFLSLGYFFSDYCFALFEKLELDSEKILSLGVILVILILAYVIYKKNKS